MGAKKSGFFLALLLLSPSASAYTPTIVAGGQTVRHAGNPRLDLAVNERNQSGLAPATLSREVAKSLQRWQAASGGLTQFDFWQGSDSKVYVPSSQYDGLSTVYFSSQGPSRLGGSVVGLTQMWYDAQTGRILETDTELNDVDFRFTADPRDSSGFGGSTMPSRNIYIGNVLTHELGHALGLSHSASLQSSLMFLEAPEAAIPSCDDQHGIRALYGVEAASAGGLSVRVQRPDGAAVFGAQVSAISLQQGRVEASVLSDTSGEARFSGLPAGEYLLLAEPYYPGASALPAYYASVTPQVCPGGAAYVRTFAGDTAIVSSGGVARASDLTVTCGSSSASRDAAVTASVGGSTMATAVPLQKTSGGAGIAIDRSGSAKRYFSLSAFSGPLRVQALAYSLYSPIRVTVSVYRSDGSRVPGTSLVPVDALSQSTFLNHDAAWVSDSSLPRDTYLIEVSPSVLSATNYPAGATSLDQTPFFLLIADSNSSPVGQVSLSARCRFEDPSGEYRSPAGDPPRGRAESSSEKVGFCGRIEDGSGGGKPGGPPPGLGAIAGWFLPWLTMAAMALGLRNRERRLNLKS